ncbi:glucose-1-phosphate cytidylyltransferase [Aquiluna sp.]|nr:glucose-1-phosphate cytidylyltransferase [Aquiluna sp.]
MKAVILAGGLGTRISEESDTKPKPMVEIGGKPMLLHIMSHFAKFGITEFIIATGYRGYQIKEYFANYFAHNNDFTVNLGSGIRSYHGKSVTMDWKVTIVDTGLETQTGGRLKRLEPFLQGEDFFLTYGDGLTDADLSQELALHVSNGSAVTVLAVRPPARFARLEISDSGLVEEVVEKPLAEGGWINGGYFIMSSKVFQHLDGDQCILERSPLEALAASGELNAFRHDGFWMAMDTLRDKRMLEDLYASGNPPWES